MLQAVPSKSRTTTRQRHLAGPRLLGLSKMATPNSNAILRSPVGGGGVGGRGHHHHHPPCSTSLLNKTAFYFEIQHFFVYVFRGYPELEGDFKIFCKVGVAATRPLSARFLTMHPSLMLQHCSLHLAAKPTYNCTGPAFGCEGPP